MAAPIHTEERFEEEVSETLKAEGWLFDGPLPYQPGHACDAGYDKRLALYPEDAIAWVKDTQPDTWDKFAKNHAKDPEGVFIQRLAEELDRDRPTIKRETPQLWGSLSAHGQQTGRRGDAVSALQPRHTGRHGWRGRRQPRHGS